MPILLGLGASACFSVTFIVNRAIGLAGGHWVWTASLRYLWVLVLLGAWLTLNGSAGKVVRAFRRHWVFWIVVGSIGYGAFYSGISFASTRAPGWLVACTMQATILATPLVLLGFGRRVRRKVVLLLGVIFVGIVVVNLDQRAESTLDTGWALLPVVVAAFAFPLGNQLMQEARAGGRGNLIPALADPETANASTRVMLMTLGSMPVWGVLLLLTRPSWPPLQQVAGAGVVAVFATLIGFTLFLRARDSVGSSANAVARVDATQAAYTVFSLLGEVVFLAGRWPGQLGVLGLVLVVGGLGLYTVASAD